MIDFCIKLINEVGFPIAVTSYLIYFLTKTMKAVLISTNNLKHEIRILRIAVKNNHKGDEGDEGDEGDV